MAMTKTVLAATTKPQEISIYNPGKGITDKTIVPLEELQKLGLAADELPDNYVLYVSKSGKPVTVGNGGDYALITIDEAGEIVHDYRGKGLTRIIYLTLNEVKTLMKIFSKDGQ